jgi:sulfonate dioxygenase
MKHIVEFKEEESRALVEWLEKYIALGADFQLRVKWEAGSVCVFDVSYPLVAQAIFLFS